MPNKPAVFDDVGPSLNGDPWRHNCCATTNCHDFLHDCREMKSHVTNRPSVCQSQPLGLTILGAIASWNVGLHHNNVERSRLYKAFLAPLSTSSTPASFTSNQPINQSINRSINQQIISSPHFQNTLRAISLTSICISDTQSLPASPPSSPSSEHLQLRLPTPSSSLWIVPQDQSMLPFQYR